jgi:alpha-L-fucosidase
LTTIGGTALAQNAVDVKPSPQQTQWQNLELGNLHLGTNMFLDREFGDGTADLKVFCGWLLFTLVFLIL